jgi:hypothetical protein
MAEFDPIETLKAAGVPFDGVNDEERAVFASLSEDEVAVLTGLKARLDAAVGDVAVHSDDTSGGNAW